MVQGGVDPVLSQRPAGRRSWSGFMVGASSVLGVVMVGLVLVAFGDLHPESRAIEVLSGHHRRGVASRDADRMQELTRLASAADKQARRASKLRDSEAGKLGAAPESKVDAEEMLAHEAKEKGVALDREMKDMRGELKRMSKTLRKDHHRFVLCRHLFRLLFSTRLVSNPPPCRRDLTWQFLQGEARGQGTPHRGGGAARCHDLPPR